MLKRRVLRLLLKVQANPSCNVSNLLCNMEIQRSFASLTRVFGAFEKGDIKTAYRLQAHDVNFKLAKIEACPLGPKPSSS